MVGYSESLNITSYKKLNIHIKKLKWHMNKNIVNGWKCWKMKSLCVVWEKSLYALFGVVWKNRGVMGVLFRPHISNWPLACVWCVWARAGLFILFRTSFCCIELIGILLYITLYTVYTHLTIIFKHCYIPPVRNVIISQIARNVKYFGIVVKTNILYCFCSWYNIGFYLCSK